MSSPVTVAGSGVGKLGKVTVAGDSVIVEMAASGSKASPLTVSSLRTSSPRDSWIDSGRRCGIGAELGFWEAWLGNWFPPMAVSALTAAASEDPGASVSAFSLSPGGSILGDAGELFSAVSFAAWLAAAAAFSAVL